MEKIRILIAEDDRTTQKFYRSYLSEDVFEIRLAKTGDEVLEFYSEWHPEIMILDLLMPYLSGFSILRKIREDVEDESTPIIICSSLSSKDDILTCAKWGIQGYLAKPLKWKEINSTILAAYEKAYPNQSEKVLEFKKYMEEAQQRRLGERAQAGKTMHKEKKGESESPDAISKAPTENACSATDIPSTPAAASS